MFLGQYRHNLDSKDRLTVPARYREPLEKGAYVMQGFDRNLMVMTDEAFDAVRAHLQGMSFTEPITRLLRRLIFSTADRVELDKAGRILIPQFLRQNMQMDGEVVLVGAGDYFEIWAPEAWAEQNAQLQDSQANAQRFAALDLSTGPAV
jgi:MraZ protein